MSQQDKRFQGSELEVRNHTGADLEDLELIAFYMRRERNRTPDERTWGVFHESCPQVRQGYSMCLVQESELTVEKMRELNYRVFRAETSTGERVVFDLPAWCRYHAPQGENLFFQFVNGNTRFIETPNIKYIGRDKVSAVSIYQHPQVEVELEDWVFENRRATGSVAVSLRISMEGKTPYESLPPNLTQTLRRPGPVVFPPTFFVTYHDHGPSPRHALRARVHSGQKLIARSPKERGTWPERMDPIELELLPK